MVILEKKHKGSVPCDDPHIRFEKGLRKVLSELQEEIRDEILIDKVINDLVLAFKKSLHTLIAINLKMKSNEMFQQTYDMRGELDASFWIFSSYLFPDHKATKVNESIRFLNQTIWSFVLDKNFEVNKRVVNPRLMSDHLDLESKQFEVSELEIKQHAKWLKTDRDYPWVYLLKSEIENCKF